MSDSDEHLRFELRCVRISCTPQSPSYWRGFPSMVRTQQAWIAGAEQFPVWQLTWKALTFIVWAVFQDVRKSTCWGSVCKALVLPVIIMRAKCQRNLQFLWKNIGIEHMMWSFLMIERVFLCGLGWCWTREPSASTSCVLWLQVCDTALNNSY